MIYLFFTIRYVHAIDVNVTECAAHGSHMGRTGSPVDRVATQFVCNERNG